MAISKVLTNTTLDSGSGGNLTVTMPGSLLSTDVCVLAVSIGAGGGGTAGSYNTPSGWTAGPSVLGVSPGANSISLQMYVCVGTPGGLTFTLTGTAGTKGYVCAAFRGVDNVTPIDASGTANSNTGAASLTTNAVTVATDQAWWIIGMTSWANGTLTSTGFTVSQNAGTNQVAGVLWNTTPRSVGSTGTQAVAMSGTNVGQRLAGGPFALRPAAAVATNNNLLLLGVG